MTFAHILSSLALLWRYLCWSDTVHRHNAMSSNNPFVVLWKHVLLRPCCVSGDSACGQSKKWWAQELCLCHFSEGGDNKEAGQCYHQINFDTSMLCGKFRSQIWVFMAIQVKLGEDVMCGTKIVIKPVILCISHHFNPHDNKNWTQVITKDPVMGQGGAPHHQMGGPPVGGPGLMGAPPMSRQTINMIMSRSQSPQISE